MKLPRLTPSVTSDAIRGHQSVGIVVGPAAAFQCCCKGDLTDACPSGPSDDCMAISIEGSCDHLPGAWHKCYPTNCS
jgi:hypothetical protein